MSGTISRRLVPACHTKTRVNFSNARTIECTNTDCPIKGQCGFYNKNVHTTTID